MVRDKKYLLFVRTCRCLVTGRRGDGREAVDPCHIGTAGKGLKSDDCHVIPLLHSVHVRCHQHGEISTLQELLSDSVLLAVTSCYYQQLYRLHTATAATHIVRSLSEEPRDWGVMEFRDALKAYAQEQYSRWRRGSLAFDVEGLWFPPTMTDES